WDQLYPSIIRYPYMIQVANAQPDGYQPSAPNPSSTGSRWSNGGGWVASGATVASGAYVGPMAAVLSGTVGATAKIDGHAVIVGGTVSSGTVTGLSIVGSGMTVSGGTENVSWPYAPGWFERPQSISGTAQLLGDIEYRGANQTETSGSYCGFVDNTISSNCTGADATVAPPYTWRD
ncbi:MAG TPA: sugar-binding protein, partial [Polyangia bacterium]|nr:sugar-binding protein [Polyangia bacterium]